MPEPNQNAVAWRDAPRSKPRAWRFIAMAAVLVVASLIAGSMVFGSLVSWSGTDHTATAALDGKPAERPGVAPGHMRF